MINEIHTLNGKSVAEVLQDFKIEFGRAASTRIKLLQEEMKQKMAAIKASIPMMVIGALFLLTAWFLFTAVIVTVIASAMPNNPWAYTIAFAAVCALYGVIGGILAMMGWSAMSKQNLKPEKTLKVLQDDKLFFQTEARRVQA